MVVSFHDEDQVFLWHSLSYEQSGESTLIRIKYPQSEIWIAKRLWCS